MFLFILKKKKYPGVELLGGVVSTYWSLQEAAKWFSKVVVDFTLLLGRYDSSICSTSLPMFGIVGLFNYSPSRGYSDNLSWFLFQFSYWLSIFSGTY